VTKKTTRGGNSKTTRPHTHHHLRSSLVAAAVFLSSCAPDTATSPDASLTVANGRTHHVTRVVVRPASADLLVGGSLWLTAKAYNAAGHVVARRKGRRFEWSSSAPEVVTVSESGRVTALAVGGPVTITARIGDVEGTALVTVSSTSLAYLSGRYRYLLIGSGEPPAGFAAPRFADRDWKVGAAGFGTGPGSPNDCPLNATVQTIWPAASAGVSDLLLRRRFRVPRRFTGSASVSVAIDNDIQVFVNGVDITASANLPLVAGFAQHEGCASRGSMVFTAPESLLNSWSNVIAVRARDRGATSYVDLEVKLVP
jgi:hypothetical protein